MVLPLSRGPRGMKWRLNTGATASVAKVGALSAGVGTFGEAGCGSGLQLVVGVADV